MSRLVKHDVEPGQTVAQKYVLISSQYFPASVLV